MSIVTSIASSHCQLRIIYSDLRKKRKLMEQYFLFPA